MILVDTSVLVDFFRGISNQKSDKFRNILLNKIPFYITPIIYQEILQGAKDLAEFNKLKEYLETQSFVYPLREVETFEFAARLYFDLRRKGITVRSSIDCLIVQIAKENDLILLHNDKDYIPLLSEAKVKSY